jgi:hypothetical protein
VVGGATGAGPLTPGSRRRYQVLGIVDQDEDLIYGGQCQQTLDRLTPVSTDTTHDAKCHSYHRALSARYRALRSTDQAERLRYARDVLANPAWLAEEFVTTVLRFGEYDNADEPPIACNTRQTTGDRRQATGDRRPANTPRLRTSRCLT